MSFISWSFFILFLVVFGCRLVLSKRNTGPAYLAVLLSRPGGRQFSNPEAANDLHSNQ